MPDWAKATIANPLQKLDPTDDIEHYITMFEMGYPTAESARSCVGDTVGRPLDWKSLCLYELWKDAESYAKVKEAILQR